MKPNEHLAPARGAYKQFNPELHIRYDSLGRDAVKRYFIAKALLQDKPYRRAVDNPDQVGVDLLLKDSNNVTVAYCEVEVRPGWHGDTFPFATVHVPERKTKLLNNDLHTWFVSVNAEQSHMLVCDAATVLNSPLREVPNRYIAENERFYDVPVSSMRLIAVPDAELCETLSDEFLTGGL